MDNDQYGYPLPPEPPGPPMPPSYMPPIGKGQAVASMVIGIVSIVFSWTVVIGFLFAIASVIGIVLAVTSKKRCAEAGLPPYGMGTAGLVLNIIGLVLNGIGFIGCVICVPLMLMMGM